uniref:Uncharacterized protein n=1 Tax=Leersia perrieri TaxID=77586 RepID=A0A0D9WC26_9ORYZ
MGNDAGEGGSGERQEALTVAESVRVANGGLDANLNAHVDDDDDLTLVLLRRFLFSRRRALGDGDDRRNWGVGDL